VRSIVKSQSKQKYQLVCIYILFFYSQLHVYISVNILFLEAKRQLLTAIQKPSVLHQLQRGNVRQRRLATKKLIFRRKMKLALKV
jgi:hypothetical protein